MQINVRNVAESAFLLSLACLALAASAIAFSRLDLSQNLAAWVQAVGSIAAIIGTFGVATYKMRQEKRAKRRAMRAVIEASHKHANVIGEFATKVPTLVEFQSYMKKLGEEMTDSFIRALDAMPLHELEEPNQVIAAVGIRSCLRFIRTHCASAIELGGVHDMYRDCLDSISLQASMSERHWHEFNKAGG